MPFTVWGVREMVGATVLFVVLSVLLVFLAGWTGLPSLSWIIVPLGLVWLWVFWFFRDPERVVPAEPGVIVSPADGTVTHLDEAEEADFIGGAARRCSIFLSVFSVHVNRAPLSGEAAYLKFRKGEYFDARREESLTKNENQDLGIVSDEPGMPARALVRQSSGAVARRIVCPVELGAKLARGQRYGMIKFGSRTTLYLSTDKTIEWRVKIGDSVKGGETVLAVVKDA